MLALQLLSPFLSFFAQSPCPWLRGFFPSCSYDVNSAEAKAQFDQMGMTPDQVVKIMMDNPDMAVAFSKPKVQAAILDCSSNPANIIKYYSDPEVRP